MEKKVSVRIEAIKEICKEKARILRKRIECPSPLEQAALAWKKKKEMEEYQRHREASSAEGLSFREAVAKKVVDYDKEKLSDLSRLPDQGMKPGDEIGWVQYKPCQKEGDKKEKQISINTATVVAIRKKLIAAEWSRALGKPKQDNRLQDLEREAVVWEQRKTEAARRKEEIRIRIQRHKEALSEALTEFGRGLTEKKESLKPEELTTFLEGCLEKAGEVFDIEWQQDNCLIWMEPWEEKKRRKILGFDIPVIYRVKINKGFQISSFEEVEDEEVIESLREELLTKPLRESLKGMSFNINNEEEAKEFLEDKLSEIGRLISLERTEYGWFVTIEPWEELRLRNTKKRGNGPIVTDEIEISWKDGKLEFALEEEDDDIDETQINADISDNQR
ncbi:MAG: hypothetical protein KJ706_10100 [Candidatus Omnitrophica bacterium]|nr:hypothetical protein [Candidatus Omnitrophota bacterium]